MSCFYGGDAHHYQNTIQKLETRIKELEANNRLLHQSNVQLRKLDEQRAGKCMKLELKLKKADSITEHLNKQVQQLVEELEDAYKDMAGASI